MQARAHDLEAKARTKDVLTEEQLNFNALLLSEATLFGLHSGGFQKPSPIQLKAIPIGKCGFDLVVESKSGTGKTAVFVIIALELINVSKPVPQVLVLAPTREVAVQIRDVVQTIGVGYEGLKVESFIGGLPVEDDIKKINGCHIVIGAPGRVKHLIKLGVLKVSSIKLFVLDEVDKLLEKNFQPDIYEIYNNLPSIKQMMTFSATYFKELKPYLEQFMLSPTYVSPNTGSPLLLGVKQFVSVVKCNLNVIHQMNIKNEELMRLLLKLSFVQCIIFTNYQTRAENICNTLNRKGWNSIYISGAQSQKERLRAMSSLKECKCRILLSTDISARGIDASNVNLIINYDVPYDASTYLHRMGRAGRYGSHGVCITLAADGKELTEFQTLLGNIGGIDLSVPKLPSDDIPGSLFECDSDKFDVVFGIVDANSDATKAKQDISNSVVGIKNDKRKCKSKNEPVKEEEKTESDLPSRDLNKREISIDNFQLVFDITSKNENIVAPHGSCSVSENVSEICIDVPTRDVPTEKQVMEQSTDELNSDLDSKKRKRQCEQNFMHNKFESSTTSDIKLKKGSPTFEVMPQSNDVTVYKNVALLNVTRLLVDDFDTSNIKDGAVDSINNYLHILKNDDKSNITDSDEIVSKINQGEEGQSKVHSDKIDDDLENIFKLGFDYAIKSNVPHWLKVLGDDFQEKIDICDDDPELLDEQYTRVNLLYDDDEPTCEYRKRNKHHHKKKKHNNYSKKENVNDSEYDSHCDKEFVQSPYENVEGGGNTVDYYPGLWSENEYSNNVHFETCFEYYNSELVKQVQTFKDTATFEDWFSEWQYRLKSVRDYVQQHIYLQEMNKYATHKT